MVVDNVGNCHHYGVMTNATDDLDPALCCRTCNGSGLVLASSYGRFSDDTTRVCPQCGGDRRKLCDLCGHCRASHVTADTLVLCASCHAAEREELRNADTIPAPPPPECTQLARDLELVDDLRKAGLSLAESLRPFAGRRAS